MIRTHILTLLLVVLFQNAFTTPVPLPLPQMFSPSSLWSTPQSHTIQPSRPSAPGAPIIPPTNYNPTNASIPLLSASDLPADFSPLTPSVTCLTNTTANPSSSQTPGSSNNPSNPQQQPPTTTSPSLIPINNSTCAPLLSNISALSYGLRTWVPRESGMEFSWWDFSTSPCVVELVSVEGAGQGVFGRDDVVEAAKGVLEGCAGEGEGEDRNEGGKCVYGGAKGIVDQTEWFVIVFGMGDGEEVTRERR